MERSKPRNWKDLFLTDWSVRSACDWLTILVLGLILYGVAGAKTIVSEYEFCIPAWTLDESGNYKCGDLKNAAWTYPHVDWSIGSFESFVIGWSPFLFLFLFNGIYFNYCYYFHKNNNTDKNTNNNNNISNINNAILNIPSNFSINTSLLRWFDAMLRCLLLSSCMTTLLGQILKFVTGLPRPNAYTLLEGDFRTGSVYVSFPSGHVAIGYTNTFLFGLYCHNAIRFAVKRKMRFDHRYFNDNTPNNNIINNNNDIYFNGHYWFLLPIWEKLHYFHTLCLCAVWSPLVFGATYIGVTRIREYWHSDVDCVAGVILGVSCAYYFGYLRYYHEIYGIFTHNTQYPHMRTESHTSDTTNAKYSSFTSPNNSGFSNIGSSATANTNTAGVVVNSNNNDTALPVINSNEETDENDDIMKTEPLIGKQKSNSGQSPKGVKNKRSIELQ